MKIIHKDLKHGLIKVKAETSEDIWYLSTIIETGDSVSGTTERKIKLGGSEEKAKISKRIVFLKIKVEKIDYVTEGAASALRIAGPITEAPDDIPKGDFHSFSIEQNTIISIEKDSWSKYALQKLTDAVENEALAILIVAFDREEALFARLKSQGYELLLDMKGDVAKKEQDDGKKGNFYKDILAQIIDYVQKYAIQNIIIATPAFWKEYLLKEITDPELKKKITLATCSGIDGSTINEILKRPELQTVLVKDKSARELKLVDELLEQIRKDNAVYGFAEVSQKVASGNVASLIISEKLIQRLRAEKKFDEYRKLEELMNAAEAINAELHLISTEDAVRKLDGITGVAATFRWRESYS